MDIFFHSAKKAGASRAPFGVQSYDLNGKQPSGYWFFFSLCIKKTTKVTKSTPKSKI
jgi:hypothetical protein